MKTTLRHWQQFFAEDGMLTAWMIVERPVYRALLRRYELTVPVQKADPDFKAAYRWLRRTMKQLGMAPPAAGLTPWWCWIQREDDHPAPYRNDLESCKDPVVLKLRLPADQVILSCYDQWHCVLNRWYCYENEAQEHAFDCLKADNQRRTATAWMEASWVRIFDLDRQWGELTPALQRSVQGCFWSMKALDVLDVIEAEALDFFEDEDCS
ncbi:hypothetical protein PS3A_61260 [Pseudomonas sp. 3A(2025)]